jgi:hypothetical protein
MAVILYDSRARCEDVLSPSDEKQENYRNTITVNIFQTFSCERAKK